MSTFFKNMFNLLEHYVCYTRGGKIIASFCKPVLVGWIIEFFIFGVPLWNAPFGFKVFVAFFSLIMGFTKAMETKQN